MDIRCDIQDVLSYQSYDIEFRSGNWIAGTSAFFFPLLRSERARRAPSFDEHDNSSISSTPYCRRRDRTYAILSEDICTYMSNWADILATESNKCAFAVRVRSFLLLPPSPRLQISLKLPPTLRPRNLDGFSANERLKQD